MDHAPLPPAPLVVRFTHSTAAPDHAGLMLACMLACMLAWDGPHAPPHTPHDAPDLSPSHSQSASEHAAGITFHTLHTHHTSLSYKERRVAQADALRAYNRTTLEWGMVRQM